MVGESIFTWASMCLYSKREKMAAQRLEFGAGNVGGAWRGEHAAQAH
jgi:hypothetical protein